MDCQIVDREGLVERYVTGQLPESDREALEAHYFTCDRCFAAVQSASRIRAALAGEDAAATPGAGPVRRSRLRRFGPAAAVLAAAAVVAALFVLRDDGAVDGSLAPLGAVTRADLPVYVDTRLRGTSATEGRAVFAAGMDAYGEGEWALAATRLESAVEADPARGLWRFYLGAALMANGRASDAVPHLRAASTDAAFREEATWLLAKARLQQGRADAAREALEGLVASGGDRTDDARALLGRLDRALESR